jgi:hypothetical protein
MEDPFAIGSDSACDKNLARKDKDIKANEYAAADIGRSCYVKI